MTKNILLVLIGGGAGSVLRYLTSLLASRILPMSFPYATLLVNIAGCFLVGVLMGLSLKSNLINADARLLLVTGFCGGFTTFSTFAYENITLMQSDNLTMALVYTLISVVLGITFVWLGLLLAR